MATSNYTRTGDIGNHRIIMEKILGRLLTEDEVVHHKDGNGKNNSPKNLQVMERVAHLTYHRKLRLAKTKIIKLKCPTCNIEIVMREALYKWKKKDGQKNFYCSRSCNMLDAGLYSLEDRKKRLDKVAEGMANDMTGHAIAKLYGLNKQTTYSDMKHLKEL